MLPFDTIHAITDTLLRAEVQTREWGAPALILLRDQTRILPTDQPACGVRTSVFAIDPWEVEGVLGGVAEFLHNTADYLGDDNAQADLRADADRYPNTSGWITADAVTSPDPDAPLLAWAVAYEDLHADPEQLRDARRVDAVDVDARVYQLTRLRGEPHPLVVIDDEVDPRDTPATYPALTALLDLTRRLETRARAH